MKRAILDLYSNYLLSSFGQTIATGLVQLMDGAISHEQVTRMLSSPRMTSKKWWLLVKPHVRKVEREDGVIIVNDSIIEKPYTDENEIICWHFDHSKDRTVKGINFVTTLYYAQDVALPLAFEIVSKTETYPDKNTGKEKRKSKHTKNARYRRMLQATCRNEIPFEYVLNDLWFASAENMRFVKLDLKKEFIMALKSNRKVAVSEDDKSNGKYQRIDQLELPEGTIQTIYLEGVPFPLHVVRQVFTNEDGSTGVRYLVTSDLTLADHLSDQIEALEADLELTDEQKLTIQLLKTMPGVGPVTAITILAEIGDIQRFNSPKALCHWAGLTPRVRKNDQVVRHGRITKQGSLYLRAAMTRAAAVAKRFSPRWYRVHEHLLPPIIGLRPSSGSNSKHSLEGNKKNMSTKNASGTATFNRLAKGRCMSKIIFSRILSIYPLVAPL